MEHYSNKIIVIGSGVCGGMGKFFLQVNTSPFQTRFFESLLTAACCALVAAFVKHMYDKFIKK
jgi:hypothetical protein